MDAKTFAFIHHQGQNYGDNSFMSHLHQVKIIVEKYLSDNSIIQAAYLHDILEDTNCTYMDLYNVFGEKTANVIWLVTDPKGENRKERKKKLYQKIEEAKLVFDGNVFNGVYLIKAADRLVNLQNCKNGSKHMIYMYKQEHEEFQKHFYCILYHDIWNEMDKILIDV